jgi:hypothetical protein
MKRGLPFFTYCSYPNEPATFPLAYTVVALRQWVGSGCIQVCAVASEP